ncbi:hypothetical protein G5I_04454 [Acromyrmex echinatior]|uniref:Uncharacterized protein n=1 Tax=Acromyrmex echinatior TaxID=103372 RepID=F4WFP5_ACREC|nr:hypothetical protein G5I_04454 [Acromyrmex echinatior]
MKILMEIDEEIFKLKNIIHELNVKNIKLHKQLYSLYVEADSQQSKIEALESSNEDLSSENNSSESIKLSDENEMSNENTYAALKKEILTLQLETSELEAEIERLRTTLFVKLGIHEIIGSRYLVICSSRLFEMLSWPFEDHQREVIHESPD